MDQIAFWLFSVLAVGMGLLAITRRKALHCALCLVVSFVSLSGIYVTLKAPFPATLQIILYAGAIMVLVVFVIMFLNAPDDIEGREEISRTGAAVALFLLIPMGALLLVLVGGTDFPDPPRLLPEGARAATGAIAADFGTGAAMGRELFTAYLYPFEIVSVLILVAMAGAVLIAKKRLD